MRRAPVLLRLSILIIILAATARADDPPGPGLPPQEEATLRHSVLHGTDAEAIYATATLFRRGGDKLLTRLLSDHSVNRATRLRILHALAIHGREKPIAACRIVRGVIRDREPKIAAAARATIIANEPLSPAEPAPKPDGTCYAFLREILEVFSNKEAPGDEERAEVHVIIEILERKQDPILAAKILIDLLPKLKGPIERRARSALVAITGQPEVESWAAWFRVESGRGRNRWLLRRMRYQERRHQEIQAELGRAAAETFAKLTDALRSDDARLLAELRRATHEAPVQAMRLQAIKLLGELGRKDNEHGRSALLTLSELVSQKRLPRPVFLATLAALGDTRRKAAASPLIKRLADANRETRLVLIRALSDIPHDEAITPIIQTLAAQLGAQSPDIELMLASIQGLERGGRDTASRASNLLASVVDQLRNDKSTLALALPEKPRAQLLEASAAALGRLHYDGPASAKLAVASLVKLIESPYPEVRFFVADSLSRIDAVDVRPQLDSLTRDTEPRVRRAAVLGIARFGLRPSLSVEQRRDVAFLLCRLLTGADPTLAAVARTGLGNLVREDFKSTLGYLTYVTECLDKRKQLELALPFLEKLSPEDAVGKNREPRYYWLLEARARARIQAAGKADPSRRESLARAAIADAARLSARPRAKGQARYTILEAQSRLLLGEARSACNLVSELIKEPQAWELWLQGLNKLRKGDDRGAVKALLEKLPSAKLNDEQRRIIEQHKQWLGRPPGSPTTPGGKG